MGLPLFHAPVESDIPSKPAVKSNADPSNTRSPIRRADRRRQLNETRQHRLQLLAALQSQNEAAVVSGRGGPPPAPRPQSTENGATSDDNLTRLDPYAPISYDDEQAPTHTGEFMARHGALRDNRHLPNNLHEYAEVSNIRADRSMDRDYSSWVPGRQSPHGRETGSTRRFRDLPYVPGRLRPPVIRRQSSFESAPASRPSRSRNPDPGEYLNEYRRRRTVHDGITRSRPRRAGRSVRYMDGLGDRDRSLSPENDSIWDNLQSTVTPDPQPPSVGSSFASTNVSAATSQTTISSSNTSITNLDEEIEPPCDPLGDNAESEEDDDEMEEQHMDVNRLPTPHGGRRSYADVAAEGSPTADDEDNGSQDFLTDMQRLVQRLAAREDIPDQWWAAVGLSRSITFDESN